MSDDDLCRWRDYLAMVAGAHLDPRLRAKVDVSGVIQQTLLEAYQKHAQLRVEHPAQELAWLRRILRNRLGDSYCGSAMCAMWTWGTLENIPGTKRSSSACR